MSINAGTKVTATHLYGPTASTQATSGTTTSTSYTATLTGGTACSAVFTAPASGAVIVHNSTDFFTSTTSFVYCTVEVRAGGVVGSGTVFSAAGDGEAVKHQTNVQTFGFGRSRLITGLTPGATYNIRQMFRVSAGTGTYLNKHMIVEPQL